MTYCCPVLKRCINILYAIDEGVSTAMTRFVVSAEVAACVTTGSASRVLLLVASQVVETVGAIG